MSHPMDKQISEITHGDGYIRHHLRRRGLPPPPPSTPRSTARCCPVTAPPTMPVRLFGSANKLIAMVATTLTKTTRGMHVLNIHGFSSVRKNNVTQMAFCTRRPSPSAASTGPSATTPTASRPSPSAASTGPSATTPTAIYTHDADGNSERLDHVAAFVKLVTEGTAAWAHVGFGLVDQTTGEMVSLFCEKDPILFDASNEDTCTWGTGEVARRSHLHGGSRYVLGDRLKIECTIDVCGDFLTFDDPPPTPSSGLPLFQRVGYGKGESDVITQVEGGTIGAYYFILDAHCT
ncbi:Speckle-type POZ protein-like protein [Hordeum vulgare]|nr:Speckle-type POZ protein-like protein [Hordeum vulgare]